jgi:imidazolonepropionase-like amidohydrolase
MNINMKTISTCTIEISFCLCVARSKVRRALESLILRPTSALRFGRAARKCKANRSGRTILALSTWAWLATILIASDQIPGGPQKRPIIIRNAIVHTVSGETIQNGCVLFKDGKITEIGINLSFPGDAEVVDGKSQHVYPGLMDSYSSIGLVEIDSIRASMDATEIGSLNPNVRAAVAFNPDSEAIPVARANGVLTAVTVPNGGLISGRAAVMVLDGWTWEGMTLLPDAAMAASWPRFSASTRGRRGSGGDADAAAATESDRLGPFHQLIREVKAYGLARSQAPDVQPIDLRLNAMLPVVNGKMPMLVQANSTKQIQTAIAFAKQYNLKLILLGGADAMQCANLIKEANVPVVLSGIYRLPSRHDDAYDSAYTLPARLQEAGILFSIASDGRFGASGLRNLPYHAATAAAFGLTEDQAVRSITLSPAEIFGVSDRIGSLAVGKDATLIVTDGNILETPTQVVRAYIQGRMVDLSSKHTQLNEKYKAKYNQ